MSTPQNTPARPRRGRRWLVAAGAVLGLVVVGNAVGEDTGTAPPTTGAATAGSAGAGGGSPAAATAAGIGDEVRDGNFAFVVTGVETDVAVLGDGFLTSTPQGAYVLVDVTVTNIGDESQLFSDSSQKLYDAQGRAFDADSGAAVMSLPDSQAFLNSINPGNTVEGVLVFDMPAGVTPTAVELHDSPFSGGATVSLTG